MKFISLCLASIIEIVSCKDLVVQQGYTGVETIQFFLEESVLTRYDENVLDVKFGDDHYVFFPQNDTFFHDKKIGHGSNYSTLIPTQYMCSVCTLVNEWVCPPNLDVVCDLSKFVDANPEDFPKYIRIFLGKICVQFTNMCKDDTLLELCKESCIENDVINIYGSI